MFLKFLRLTAKLKVLENVKRSWERSWKVMKFEELKGVRSLIDKWSKHLTHFPYDYFKRKLISCISWDYINSFFRESVVDNLAGAVNDPVFYPWEVRMVIDFNLLCTMS